MEAEVGEQVVISAAVLRTWRMRIENNDRTFDGLKKLKLRGKELGRPAPEIFHLTEVQVLDLSPERQACLFYHLPEVPPAIARMRNLCVLMLDTNDLREVPTQLGQLANLERLSLSNNMLTSLPDSFAQLRKLTSLHAANNGFQQIPDCLYAVTSLCCCCVLTSAGRVGRALRQSVKLRKERAAVRLSSRGTSVPMRITRCDCERCNGGTTLLRTGS